MQVSEMISIRNYSLKIDTYRNYAFWLVGTTIFRELLYTIKQYGKKK